MSSYDRPDWREYYLGLAEAASARADCRRRKVGAVVVYQNRVVGVGYNGTDAGRPGCLDGACPRGLLTYEQQPAFGSYTNCIARHAEVNAILNVQSGESVIGADLYVNHSPCDSCLMFARMQGLNSVTGPMSGVIFPSI